MKELIIAFGLFLFIEGILYAIFPSKMKSMLKKLELVNDSQLRTGGLIFAIIGFIIIYFYEGIDHSIWSFSFYRGNFVCHISIKNEKYVKKIRTCKR